MTGRDRRVGDDGADPLTRRPHMPDPITAREFHATGGTEDWRVVHDGACTFVPTPSLAASAALVSAIAALPGLDDHRPDIDVRPDGVTVRLLTYEGEFYGLSRGDVERARAISGAVRELGLACEPADVQSVLIVPGAADPSRIMPFWEAAMGYVRRADTPDEDLLDPHHRWPGLWFEGMDEPRTAGGGGAIHVAVFVPVGRGQARVDAALAAGGHVVRDRAPMWWTLADEAGNELDVATLEGRD
jgi:4a-hydroxytetrahydrobiopterin dehydratase